MYDDSNIKIRNKKIVDAVIRRAELLCPNSVALIGVMGSFSFGDTHEKSDLDICIVINDYRGNILNTAFILDDIGFHFYCTTWEQLEGLSNYTMPYVSELLGIDIVYSSDDIYLARHKSLCSRLRNILDREYSRYDFDNANRFIISAKRYYADIMLSSSYGDALIGFGRLIYNLEQCIYLHNKSYIRRGIKRIPEDIVGLEYLPRDYSLAYSDLSNISTIEDIKSHATKLLNNGLEFTDRMQSRLNKAYMAPVNALRGTYETVYSNGRNKMQHASETSNPYLTLVASFECQEFYDDIYDDLGLPSIKLMDSISLGDLNHSSKVFLEAMDQLVEQYEKHGLRVKNYDSVDDFVMEYSGLKDKGPKTT